MFAISLIAFIFSQLAGASSLVCPKALVPPDSISGASWERRLGMGGDDPWLEALELPVRRALFWKALSEHPKVEAVSDKDSPEIYRLRRSKKSQALSIAYSSLERLRVWENLPSPGSLYSNLSRGEVFDLLAILFEHSTSIFQNPLAPDFSVRGLATKLKPNIEVSVREITSQGKIRVLRKKGSGAIYCGVRHFPGTRVYQLLIPVPFAVRFFDHRYQIAQTDTLVLTVAQWPNHNETYLFSFSPLYKELWDRESAFFQQLRSNKKSKRPLQSGLPILNEFNRPRSFFAESGQDFEFIFASDSSNPGGTQVGGPLTFQPPSDVNIAALAISSYETGGSSNWWSAQSGLLPHQQTSAEVTQFIEFNIPPATNEDYILAEYAVSSNEIERHIREFLVPKRFNEKPQAPLLLSFDGDTPPELKSTDPHRRLIQWHRRLTWMQTRVRRYRAEIHTRWGKSVTLSKSVLSQLSRDWQRYELAASELNSETAAYQTFLFESYFPTVEKGLAKFVTEEPLNRSVRNRLIFQGLRALSYSVGHPGLAEYWDKNFQDMLPWEHRRVFSLFHRAERLLNESALSHFAACLKDPKVASLNYDELCRWGDQFLRYHGEPEFHPLFFPKGS